MQELRLQKSHGSPLQEKSASSLRLPAQMPNVRLRVFIPRYWASGIEANDVGRGQQSYHAHCLWYVIPNISHIMNCKWARFGIHPIHGHSLAVWCCGLNMLERYLPRHNSQQTRWWQHKHRSDGLDQFSQTRDAWSDLGDWTSLHFFQSAKMEKQSQERNIWIWKSVIYHDRNKPTLSKSNKPVHPDLASEPTQAHQLQSWRAHSTQTCVEESRFAIKPKW